MDAEREIETQSFYPTAPRHNLNKITANANKNNSALIDMRKLRTSAAICGKIFFTSHALFP
jgi:hypothetical protein